MGACQCSYHPRGPDTDAVEGVPSILIVEPATVGIAAVDGAALSTPIESPTAFCLENNPQVGGGVDDDGSVNDEF